MLRLLPPNARSAPETIFPDTVTPANRPSDAPNWELGTIFRVEIPGAITQVRVFSLAEEFGDHQVRIWRNADNTLIAGPTTWTFGGEEAWITLDIPDVSIQADQDYTVSISATADGWYPVNADYFGSAGGDGQNLDYPQGAGVFSDTAGLRPTNSFNNSAYLRDIVFEPDLSGAVMKVKGNGIGITDGASNPFPANGTDMGGRDVNAGTRDQIYTISNIGQTSLELSGNPKVAISGAQAGDFVVTVQPAATVPPGGETTFTVRFDPSAIGIRTAALSIAHADSPANPFDFAIQGTGLGGGAGVLGNDSEGTSWWLIGAAQIHGNRFESPHNMRIAKLQAKVLELAGTFKCAVYSETNGLADRLLRSSVEVLNATNGWNTFALTSPLDLTAGDYYWLVIWSDTAEARVQIDPVGTAYWGTYSYLDLGGQWPDPISLTGGQLEKTYCIYAEGTPVGAVSGPAIDLRGNGKLIVSGDTTPSLLDGTDFGSLNVGSATPEQTFTIENPGDAALELTQNPPVSITGPHASDFNVTSPPASSVAPGGSTTFKVRFQPSVRGLRAATVSIANNNAGATPYGFAVQGAGLATGRESIWPDTKTGKPWPGDTVFYELGTIFRSSVAGKITHLRVYSITLESGNHTARIWRNDDDTVIGGPYTWNYGGVAGWISFDIPDVDIDANVDYTVVVSVGGDTHMAYPNLGADILKDGSNGQHLSYPANAGVFVETRDTRPAQSYNGGNYLRDIIFVPAGATVDLPDMDVRGNNISIPDGASSPGSANGTDFGQTTVGGSVERTFTIANVGTAPLNLSATPKVAITGPQAGDFTVVAQPTSPIAPGGNASITLRFAPSAAGVRNATVTIENDSDKNPYDFGVAGTGTAVAAQLRITEVKPDVAAGSITLRWEGDGPQFRVEKAATVTSAFQPVAPRSRSGSSPIRACSRTTPWGSIGYARNRDPHRPHAAPPRRH